MISVSRLLTLLIIVTSTFSVSAQNLLNEARANLEKWVETRQLISKTKTDWQSDKELLEQTKHLFEREWGSIQEQMSRLGTNTTQVHKEQAEAESLKQSSNESLERCRQLAAELEVELKKLVAQFPQPLQDILKPSLNRFPAGSNTRMTAAERMQIIVGMLNELDKFNSGVSVFNEKRKDQRGDEVAVETVYIGLGAAFFVNGAGDFAGTGAPGANGWEWTPEPQLAPAVREIIQIYRNERPARFIPLPAVVR